MKSQGKKIVGIAGALLITLTTVIIMTTLSDKNSLSLASDDDKISQLENNVALATTANGNGSLTIVTVARDGSLVGEAKYQITSYPDPGFNYTIMDNGEGDQAGSTAGIINIIGIPSGNFVVTQTAAKDGYLVDILSKIVEITDEYGASATFTNSLASEGSEQATPITSVTYTTKFHCGTIYGDEGPLRPGHYDTDISILNAQNYPVRILWNAIVNDGTTTNAIIRTLQPESSTAIVCNDLAEIFDISNDSKKLVEGFVIIRVQVEGTAGFPAEGSVIIDNSPEINVLDVQVFYTANALDVLPHTVLVDKITFSILNDTSGKIPPEMMKKTLDVTIDSSLNKISNPEAKVKEILAEQYNMSDQELDALKIRIRTVSVGVGTMIDDHAISLFRVAPQASG